MSRACSASGSRGTWSGSPSIPQGTGSNLFQILADGIAGARDHMDIETLAVIGASFKDGSEGFYVLSSEAGPFVPAHAEELLDPSCELARGAR